MLNAFIADFLYAAVALFVIIDPVGTAIIFAALTTHDDAAKRRTIAKRASAISFLVLLVFGLAGEKLLRLLGIGIPALQIAGGALLFLSAKDMVTAKGELRASSEERSAASESTEDISVFPLAIPLIAGPGGMTTMVLLHAKAGGQPGAVLANALALAAMIAATLVSMLGARRLARLMG
ncbi:MarC family protein, partial [Acidiphilium sp. JA12-A1]